MIERLLRDQIWASGRGPELRRVHIPPRSASIVAIDYLNPDARSDNEMKHLVIHRPQVSMTTPEEVYSYSADKIDWGPPPRQAAVVNLGKTEWLRSFAQRHLTQCNHYRILFYDQIIDLICEGISAEAGPYSG
jgi:hypothetical protein